MLFAAGEEELPPKMGLVEMLPLVAGTQFVVVGTAAIETHARCDGVDGDDDSEDGCPWGGEQGTKSQRRKTRNDGGGDDGDGDSLQQVSNEVGPSYRLPNWRPTVHRGVARGSIVHWMVHWAHSLLLIGGIRVCVRLMRI